MWKHSNVAHQALTKAFGVALEDWSDLAKIPDLFMTAWKKYYHPILSMAYVFNPEYHRTKPWEDPTVKKDMETVLRQQLPGTEE